MRRSAIPLLLFVVLQGASRAGAAPGDLDPSFGGDGIVTTDFGGSADRALAVVVQGDGKVVAAGTTVLAGDSDFALARYGGDGALDTSFGGDGIVTTDLGGSLDQIRALVLLPDGKLVAAGITDAGGDSDFALARYTPDGSLDTSFGVGGIVMTDVAGGDDGAFALARQANGKLVSVGGVFTGISTDLAVLRYEAGGGLDAGFGSAGMTTAAIGFETAIGRAVVLAADGKIVAAGSADFVTTGEEVAIVRLTSSGAFDGGFDGDGVVTPTLSNGDDLAHALGLQTDGKIVIAAEVAAGASHHIAVLRRLTSGAPDPTFDLDGVALYPLGSSSVPHAVVPQADGRIVVAGRRTSGGQSDVVLLRIDVDGGLDATFGSGGAVITAIGSAYDAAAALAPQGDKLIVAGTSFNGDDDDFAVLRYIGSDCGDGSVDGGEQCDDGNAAAGDCCSPTCQFEASGSSCAADALPCTADRCNGSGVCTHPAGNAGVTCRAAAHACDAAETCSGASTGCPSDAPASDGTSCADASFCNGGETCQAGACQGGVPPCTGCDENFDACPGACPGVARTDCRAADASSLVIRRRTSGNHRLVWRWSRGQSTSHADLADPRASAAYLLCVYEGAGGGLAAQTSMPPDAARWRVLGAQADRGFRYADSAAAVTGIRRALLRPGIAGKAKAVFVGTGSALPDPALPLDLPVRVQLSNAATGVCLGSVFTGAARNDASVFRR